MPHNRIFLSHRGLDKPIVKQYRDALEAAGFRPWMDVTDIQTGAHLERTLQQGMASSCAAVFFVTPHYEDSAYLAAEIDDALRQQVMRGDGFRIITLVFTDANGKRVTAPEPLRKYVWGEPKTHLEGIKCIMRALPPHLLKRRGYLPLDEIVAPTARQVALVGQNLNSRIWLDHQRYKRFLKEVKTVLSRPALETLSLVMMIPKVLYAVHPEAARHLLLHTLPGLDSLHQDLPGEQRITVAFHPAATLSLIAVDWGFPDSAFALMTPKFQRTSQIDDRVSVLFDDKAFNPASMAQMLLDANEGRNKAVAAPLRDAAPLLKKLLEEVPIAKLRGSA